MKPSVQPVITATTDSVSSPFLLQKSLTRLTRSPVTESTKKDLIRSPIFLSVPPGAKELWSERTSSSPLGNRSSSMTSKVVGSSWHGNKAEVHRGANLFHRRIRWPVIRAEAATQTYRTKRLRQVEGKLSSLCCGIWSSWFSFQYFFSERRSDGDAPPKEDSGDSSERGKCQSDLQRSVAKPFASLWEFAAADITEMLSKVSL